ncbi:PepSY domain-containing protein [Streptomyces fulvoviolaceus]|uniref:PepSY domain-containing protein n=1 Tax=Streptomyces fulvoviolaceus TaxID=285535 RepID=UPI0021C23D09|nr:PepSY domain-containing protein [Streptomyces fulvoviolaceus]MCT9080754.1 PepSY domain-containing protein [Streptomyces fulvoviolaceus]
MKRNIVIATLTAAALATGGTVAAFAAGDDDATATQRQTSTGAQVVSDDDSVDDSVDDSTDDRSDDATEDRTAVRNSDITAADAIAAALRHTPGTAVSADLDDEGDDIGTWDVDVVKSDGTEYSVDVSSDTGKVLKAHRENDDDNDGREDLTALKGAKVDVREAALAAAAKGTVTEVGLDDDNGAVAWGVETVKDTTHGEWKVDLQTGKVAQDRDDHDNDGDDD